MLIGDHETELRPECGSRGARRHWSGPAHLRFRFESGENAFGGMLPAESRFIPRFGLEVGLGGGGEEGEGYHGAAARGTIGAGVVDSERVVDEDVAGLDGAEHGFAEHAGVFGESLGEAEEVGGIVRADAEFVGAFDVGEGSVRFVDGGEGDPDGAGFVGGEAEIIAVLMGRSFVVAAGGFVEIFDVLGDDGAEHGFGERVDFAGVHEGGESGFEVEGVGLLDGGGVGIVLVHYGALVEGGGDGGAEVFEGGG